MSRTPFAPHLAAQWLRSQASEHPQGHAARILPGSIDPIARRMAQVLPDDADEKAKADCLFEILKFSPQHTRPHLNVDELSKLNGAELLAYANEGSVPPPKSYRKKRASHE
jgi:hypothetical protein